MKRGLSNKIDEALYKERHSHSVERINRIDITSVMGNEYCNYGIRRYST